jgi:hypothetical protein
VSEAKGSLKVEEYGLDALAASAEAVMAGLGPVVAGLARLAGAAGQSVTLAQMEQLWSASRAGRSCAVWCS